MPLPHFKIYKAGDGWRWQFKAANGRLIAESGEAYTSRSGATKALRRMIELILNSRDETWSMDDA